MKSLVNDLSVQNLDAWKFDESNRFYEIAMNLTFQQVVHSPICVFELITNLISNNR